MHPNSALPNNTTAGDAEEHIGEHFWPAGLSFNEERAAWELIEIKDGRAALKETG